MNKFLLVSLIGVAMALLLFVAAPYLAIASDPNERTTTVSGIAVAYTAAWTPRTLVHAGCSREITDRSGNGQVSIDGSAGTDCESGVSHVSVTIKPDIDLHEYATVVLRRTATIENSCEGQYSTLTASIDDVTTEFGRRTGSGHVAGKQVLRDIYCSNDGLRIKCDSDEGTLLTDDQPGTRLTLTADAGCTFHEGSSHHQYALTRIETTPFTGAHHEPTSTLPYLIGGAIGIIGASALLFTRRKT